MSDGAINNVRLVPGIADQLKVVKPGVENINPQNKAESMDLKMMQAKFRKRL